MKLRKLRMTPAAKADLRDIWDYSRHTWGNIQAKKYMDDLHAQYNALKSMPYLGKPVPEMGAELHMLQCSYHYAYYLIEPESITFVAFLHEQMNRLRHLAQRLPSTPH